MFKRLTILLLPVLIIALGGCATAKKKDLEMQALKNQISVLEAQVQARDQEIAALKEQPSVIKDTLAGAEKISNEIKSHPKAKEIQLALKNAGYYLGEIDGRIGRATREAIKSFQKAHDLVADGKMGRKTWEALRKYLDEKIK